jgi:hypothetical protein
MWPKHYRDYPVNGDQVQQKVEPQKGIIGCEMHERNGWGIEQHRYRKRRRGLMKLLTWFLGERNE